MDKLQVIADYSMDQLAHDQTGHGSDHTKRVVKLAEKILETEPQADRFVTLAAAFDISIDEYVGFLPMKAKNS